ncbi:protein translocase subunit SecD [Hydrogenophaga sp. 5NK40-0174]|uniref:protein translocase subunit SecD n=1 Tax=Hydrogenophaga sp. 5NK40-0174 TaxID=3127649 RepID=UPI003341224D
MNRYPLWKYAIIAVALVVGLLYAAPNLFGSAPSVQVSSASSTVVVDDNTVTQVASLLEAKSIQAVNIAREGNSIKARFADEDTQLKARDVIDAGLNQASQEPDFLVAVNLEPLAPQWMRSLNAQPMYLGLDLRGGVHFMLQVDMQAALDQRSDAFVGDLRTAMREARIRNNGMTLKGQTITIQARDAETAEEIRKLIDKDFSDLTLDEQAGDGGATVVASLRPESARTIQEQALKQNITTLHNRVNELGVAEPVIQQQGADRIVVQLPGVQDTAKAKDIIGRTATLQVRLVDESAEGRSAERGTGPVPFGAERYPSTDGRDVIVKREVILTGENLTDAQAGFDNNGQPAVHLRLDSKGARIFRDVTGANINKRMAIILFEKGKGKVVTAPVIRTEIGGGQVQISGAMSTAEAHDTALLLRAGSLAAPMDIIEERTVGPSLGKQNIEQGFNSVIWGFLVIVVFMCIYYAMFGVFSSLALAVNLVLLVAILSMLQATLTLPGIAAMALALGMAIDSNVLINERIREELRNGSAPQTAISAGYEHAWGTILDSNVTTLIAGIALFIFGSGPVKGFAVVHCVGIITSMFSSVVFSRGLANLWYGRHKKLKSISIGTVWKNTPKAPGAV